MRDHNLGVVLRGIVDAPDAAVPRRARRVRPGSPAPPSPRSSTTSSRPRLVARARPVADAARRPPRRPAGARARGPSPRSAWRSTSTTSASARSTSPGDVLAEHVELGRPPRQPTRRRPRPARRARRPRARRALRADGVRVAGTALALPGPGRPRHRPAARRAEPRLARRRRRRRCSPRTPCSAALPAAPRQRGQPRRPRRGARARRGSPSFVVRLRRGRHRWRDRARRRDLPRPARLERRDRAHRRRRVPRAARVRRQPRGAAPARTRCCARPGLPGDRPARRPARRAAAGRAAARPPPSRRPRRALGVALANVVNVVDVGEVVLGGTFGQLFDHVHDEVSARLDELVIFAPWSPLRGLAGPRGPVPRDDRRRAGRPGPRSSPTRRNGSAPS